MSLSPAEQKRAVCAGLTGVVKDSQLPIDPKAFFMMLNANFAMLARGDALDLTLLWEPLRSSHSETQILPLFLRFEEVARQLGMSVVHPPEVAALPPEQRRHLLALAAAPGQPRTSVPPTGRTSAPPPSRSSVPPQGRSSVPPQGRASVPPGMAGMTGHGLRPVARGEAGLPGDEGAPIPLPPEELTPLPALEFEPTPLPDSAYGDESPEQTEFKKKVTKALVTYLKATPAGRHLQSAQISFFIASRFGTFCDGRQFFYPILRDALLDLEGVTEEDLYLAAVRFRRWLARHAIELVEPEWRLDAATRERLEAMSANLGPAAYARPAPPPEKKEEAPPAGAQERQAKRLKKYGLSNLKLDRTRIFRYVVYGFILAIGVVAGVALRPVKSGDVRPYQAVMPLADMSWIDGRFVGTLDAEAWFKLAEPKRREALKALTAMLKRERKISGAKVVHPKTRTAVIWEVNSEELSAAPQILTGTDPFLTYKPRAAGQKR